MSSKKNPQAEFAYGASNINPLKALNPGLIYDIHALGYITFLCANGYNIELLHLVAGDNSSYSGATKGTVFDLNYPSFAIILPSFKSFSQVYHRIVTNVGLPTSMYKAIVTNTVAELRIKVNPSVLAFTSLGQKLSFALTIEGTPNKNLPSASLVWDDGKFKVKSPIVIAVNTDD
jgi:hypothetical protein